MSADYRLEDYLSEATVRAIRAHYGYLPQIRVLRRKTVKDLLRIRGIGRKRADHIWRAAALIPDEDEQWWERRQSDPVYNYKQDDSHIVALRKSVAANLYWGELQEILQVH